MYSEDILEKFKLEENGELNLDFIDTEILVDIDPSILENHRFEKVSDLEDYELQMKIYKGVLDIDCIEVDDETIITLYEDILENITIELQENMEDDKIDTLKMLVEDKVFKCHFIKKDNSVREMICEFESFHKIKDNLIIVYDLVKDCYRHVNLETLTDITIDRKKISF